MINWWAVNRSNTFQRSTTNLPTQHPRILLKLDSQSIIGIYMLWIYIYIYIHRERAPCCRYQAASTLGGMKMEEARTNGATAVAIESWIVIKIVMMASSAGVWLKKISTKQTIKQEWLLTFSLAISSSLLCWNPLGSIFPSSTESLWATRCVTSKQTYLWWSQCCFHTSPQQCSWWGQCKELPLWRGYWHPKGIPELWLPPLNSKLQCANNIQTK